MYIKNSRFKANKFNHLKLLKITIWITCHYDTHPHTQNPAGDAFKRWGQNWP